MPKKSGRGSDMVAQVGVAGKVGLVGGLEGEEDSR